MFTFAIDLVEVSSAVLVQMNGCFRWFQPVMKARIFDYQVAGGGECAAADRLAFDDAEPDLDQVQS